MQQIGLSDAQLAMRSTGIGASEVGAICGLNPFKATIDVWLEKTGRAEPFAGNKRTQRGHIMEPHICEWYAQQRGVTLEKSDTLRSDRHEWLFATPDRLVIPADVADGVLECKNVGHRVMHHWADGVPLYVVSQSLTQMYVTGLHRADVAVWFDDAREDGTDEDIYPVPWDADAMQDMLDICEEFWRENVLKDVPPAIDASESWSAYLKKRYPKSTGGMLPGNEEIGAWVRRHVKLKSDEKTLKEQIAECEHHIKAAIGDADGMRQPGEWRATWRSDSQGAVSWKSVAEAMNAPAAIVEKFRGAAARKLLVREEK